MYGPNTDAIRIAIFNAFAAKARWIIANIHVNEGHELAASDVTALRRLVEKSKGQPDHALFRGVVMAALHAKVRYLAFRVHVDEETIFGPTEQRAANLLDQLCNEREAEQAAHDRAKAEGKELPAPTPTMTGSSQVGRPWTAAHLIRSVGIRNGHSWNLDFPGNDPSEADDEPEADTASDVATDAETAIRDAATQPHIRIGSNGRVEIIPPGSHQHPAYLPNRKERRRTEALERQHRA